VDEGTLEGIRTVLGRLVDRSSIERLVKDRARGS